MHIRSLFTPILIGTLALACDNPADKQREADKARQESVDKSEQAQREADQKKIEEQSKADQKQREAMLTLDEKRNDYKKRINDTLSDIDRHVADLRTKDVKASPKDKAKNDQTIDGLNGKRSILSEDLKELDKVTPANWEDFSKKVDRDLKDAKNLMSPFAPKT